MLVPYQGILVPFTNLINLISQIFNSISHFLWKLDCPKNVGKVGIGKLLHALRK